MSLGKKLFHIIQEDKRAVDDHSSSIPDIIHRFILLNLSIGRGPQKRVLLTIFLPAMGVSLLRSWL